MKKNNKGFTLGEVLVTVVIIGVVMALSVQTFKIIRTSYTPLAYFSFKNIRAIVFMLTSTTLSEQVMVSCKNSNGEIIRVLTPDGYTGGSTIPACSSLPSGTGTSVVCNNILDLVNTSGTATTCTNLYSVNTSTSEPTISGLNPDSPTFKTTNGQRYYVSYNVAAGGDFEYGYRLIAVDLNGTRPPNTTSSANEPPDIVTFMVMDNGEIYPLGVAADNYTTSNNKHINYIAASLKGYCYPKITQDASGQNIPSFSHCPLTDSAYVPDDCIMNTSSGSKVTTCYYKIERPKNVVSYRNAYCSVIGNTLSYESYCTSAGLPLFRQACPPFQTDDGKNFDLCSFENIKPLFRFNFD